MNKYKCDIWDEKSKDWTLDKEINPYITETAGFIPLEVQIQKFQQSGQRARFRSDMFDSADYYDMYMHPDVRVNSEDDIESIQDKMQLQRYLALEIARQKAQGKPRKSVEQILQDRERKLRSEAEQLAANGPKDSPTPPAAGAESPQS